MIWLLIAALSGIMIAALQLTSAYALYCGVSIHGVTSLQLWMGTLGMLVLLVVLNDFSQLSDIGVPTALSFMVGGVIQFLLGGGLANMSQHRIGATQTSLLIAMTPLIGALMSILVHWRLPAVTTVLAMLVMIWGAVLIHGRRGTRRRLSMLDLAPGLCSAICFAGAALLILEALRHAATPTLGAIIGMGTGALLHGLRHPPWRALPRNLARPIAIRILIWTAAAVSLSIYGRWASLAHLDLGTCLALALLSLPTLLIVAPRVLPALVERIGLREWLGALLIVGGALSLFFNA